MMSEEEKVVTTMENRETADNSKYIEAIEELKRNTVPKERYEKLENENKKLFQSLVNGEANGKGEAAATRTRAELDKVLFGSNNLETAKAMIELKERIKEEDGVDNVFNARGPNAAVTQESLDRNEEVYEGLKQLIKESGDDPVVFNALLQNAIK